MKVLMRLLVVGVVLSVVLLPLTASADRLPAPLEKKLSAGTHTVTYAGQQLRFDSPVSLLVRFEPLSTYRIKLSVIAYGPSGGGQSSASEPLLIYWENFQDEVYYGPPPVDSEWEGVINTESGFTEK